MSLAPRINDRSHSRIYVTERHVSSCISAARRLFALPPRAPIPMAESISSDEYEWQSEPIGANDRGSRCSAGLMISRPRET